MKTLIRIFLLLAGLFMLAGVLQAQDEPAVRGPAAERLERWRKLRILEALTMDEETAIRFFARYNKHVQAMRDIGQDRNAMVDQLQAMVRSGATDAEFEKVTEKLVKSDEQNTEARKVFLQELKQILSPKQIASYIVFERNFRRNVGEIIREMSQERLGRRPER